MKRTKICPKCECTEIIQRARLRALRAGEVELVTEGDPGAFILTEDRSSCVGALVCASCGYTEFYAENPEELAAAHRAAEERIKMK